MLYLPSFAILFFSLGCSPEPVVEERFDQPAADSYVPPNVSFDGETVIEPMFPTEESEESEEILEEFSLENTNSALQTQPNPKLAAEASNSLPLPKVGDLVPQVEAYIKKLENTLDDLDGSPRFAQDADVLYRDANALALIVLALGLSKEDNPYKKAAPAIIAAAVKLETVKSFDEAAKAIAELKQSLKAEGDPAALSWDKKVASLKPLMKAVPNINTLVKRNLRTEAALRRGNRIVVEGAAAMAVIGQGSIPNIAETIKPDAVKEWTAYCIEFRDVSLALNQAASDYEAGRGTFGAVQDAYEALSDSCDSCHTLFYHGEVPKD